MRMRVHRHSRQEVRPPAQPEERCVLQHIRDYEPNVSGRMDACRYATMHLELSQNRVRNPWTIEAGTQEVNVERYTQTTSPDNSGSVME